MSDRTLVVGAGQAGLQVAESLRDLGYSGPITVVGEEPHPPYQRPPLSKESLRERGAGIVPIRPAKHLARIDVDLVTSRRITSVVRNSQEGIAEDDQGTQYPFNSLVLATGSQARRLLIPGADGPGLYHLRTADDARLLANALTGSPGPRLVVVGGGFIGLEIAAGFAGRAASVSVVEQADALLTRALAPTMSSALATALRTRGVRVLQGVGVSAVERGADGRVTAILTSDGQRLPADVVAIGIGIGAEPDIRLAEAFGLACNRGVMVNARGLASDTVTLAAGDCTRPAPSHFNPRGDRVESVANAVDQGRAVAATLLGLPTPPERVPWFWSVIGDMRLQIAGLMHPGHSTVLRGDPNTAQFSTLHFDGTRLVAVQSLNDAQTFATARRALQSGQTTDPAGATDSSRPLTFS